MVLDFNVEPHMEIWWSFRTYRPHMDISIYLWNLVRMSWMQSAIESWNITVMNERKQSVFFNFQFFNFWEFHFLQLNSIK